MLCDNCKQQDASVHITEVNHATSQKAQRHFCSACAELFQQSDLLQRMLRRLPMIKFRVAVASPERTVLNVLGGPHDGETWSFATDRLRQLQVEARESVEFELEEDEAYIKWLKGEQPAL